MTDDRRTRPTTMSPERWKRLQELFERALATHPAQRRLLLEDECGSDPALCEQVLALVAASEEGNTAAFEERVEKAIDGSLHPAQLRPGQIVDRYRIVELIGRGGMGAVYLAERADQQFQQRAALKVVERGLAGQHAQRFRAERQILALLEHPNIARLLDGGQTHDGTPYLVMEYVDGQRIDVYCREHTLDVEARVRLMQQVCAAVQYAHQSLVVHRDIKPSNILVTTDGTPKLLDFGIAKLLDAPTPEGTVPVTRLLDRVLTPEHASPEQLRGEAVRTVSDVYGLGVLLYELLAEAHPYELRGLTLPQIQHAVCETQPPPPSVVLARASAPHLRARTADVRGDLDTIVLKAMHPEPGRRYPSALALAEDLQNFLEGRPIEARPDTFFYRAGKFIRRNALATGAAAVSLVAIISLVAFYTQRLATERDVAERERQRATHVAEFMIDVFRRANPNVSGGDEVTVRAALDAAASRIETDLAGLPQIRVTLMRHMGQSYSGIGSWTEAKDLLERTVAAARENLGDDDVELIRALEALGHVEYNMSRNDEAASHFAEAEAIRVATGLDRNAGAARLQHSIASVLRAQQKYTEALEVHRKAESLARALNPQDPAVLGHVLQGFAYTYMDAGDFAAAERYARESLPLLRGVIYEGYDLYANSLFAYANVLRRQYKFAEALEADREFIERQTAMLGRDHQLVGRAYNSRGLLLRSIGDYAAGEQAFAEALRIYAANVKGGAPYDAAVGHHNLGGLYREAGRLEDAARELRRALELKRQLAGERSPQVVSTLLELAAVHRLRNRLEESGRALAEAESVAAEKFDPNDRRHAVILIERGRYELARGRAAAALEVLSRASTALREQDDPLRLADTLAGLGDAEFGRGNFTEAARLHGEALDLRRNVLPASHWSIAEGESQLGAALVRAGERDRGLALLRSARDKLRATRPDGDVIATASERRLADLGS